VVLDARIYNGSSTSMFDIVRNTLSVLWRVWLIGLGFTPDFTLELSLDVHQLFPMTFCLALCDSEGAPLL
jgi:hypothetical protein